MGRRLKLSFILSLLVVLLGSASLYAMEKRDEVEVRKNEAMAKTQEESTDSVSELNLSTVTDAVYEEGNKEEQKEAELEDDKEVDELNGIELTNSNQTPQTATEILLQKRVTSAVYAEEENNFMRVTSAVYAEETNNYYRFTAAQEGVYYVTLKHSAEEKEEDMLHVLRSDAQTSAELNSRHSDQDIEKSFYAAQDESVYLQVKWNNNSFNNGNYTLRISPSPEKKYFYDQGNRLTKMEYEQGLYQVMVDYRYDANGSLLDRKWTKTEIMNEGE